MKHLTDVSTYSQCLRFQQLSVIFFSIVLVSGSVAPAVFADHLTAGSGIGAGLGGVNNPGTWFLGENLKVGDYFKFKTCHASFKDCTEFWMSIWIEKAVFEGGEEKLRAQVVIEDGNKVLKGQMDMGTVVPEPLGGTVSENIIRYSSVYKSSIAWLSSFVTGDIDQPGKGPKAFNIVSWGKIGNIGGEQVSPIGEETMRVPAGEYDTVVIGWKSGGKTSHIYVVDEFPFPIKASTWQQVTEGIPPQEYRFSLYEYEQNVSVNPFIDVVDTGQMHAASGCTTEYDLVKLVKNTNTNSMSVTVFYGPEKPRIECELELRIQFKKAYASELWEGQVHYDILRVDIVDGKTIPKASAADDEGRDKFFTTSGQTERFWLMQGEPGLETFAIIVYGVGPEFSVPDAAYFGYFTFDIELMPSKLAPKPTVMTEPETSIPDWIKNNAEWWASGQIPDSAFVSGIQWLITNNIIVIPPTEQDAGTGANIIPNWIKNNAGWWASGQIPDSAFVSGLQWLITNGIITIS
ncbi:hypothetical protein AAA799O18_00083 [Marine Group I thaumarchaeote SCGC AAA799-O18]|nr:hypothetical protein AAA799O18_00083 [Marine Group I thaumarchaeote SCGC AAA799-O18]